MISSDVQPRHVSQATLLQSPPVLLPFSLELLGEPLSRELGVREVSGGQDKGGTDHCNHLPAELQEGRGNVHVVEVCYVDVRHLKKCDGHNFELWQVFDIQFDATISQNSFISETGLVLHHLCHPKRVGIFDQKQEYFSLFF